MQKRYPFKFLDAYTREDSDFFFGRKEEIDTLYQMSFQSDLLLVYGASGTGKTSLIQCGLASRFESHDWLALNIRRGSDLNASLEKSLLDAGGGIENQDSALDWLDEEWLSGHGIATSTKNKTKQDSTIAKRFKAIYLKHFKPIYLIFDQFEELYILGSKAEQAQFIETVKAILQVEQPVKIIISIREEYLGHLYEFERAVPSLLRRKLRVEAMNLDKVGTVIKGLAELPQSNVTFKSGEEKAIAEALFSKIRDTDNSLTIQLPYLQVVLDKLYLQISGDSSRKAAVEFSLSAVKAMGDLGDVLRNFLDEQVMSTARKLDQKPTQIWAILSPFVTLDGTKEPVSEALLQKRLPNIAPELLKNILQLFINERLVRYYKDDELYEIAHDSLAKKIAEKRSDEEVALLRVQQIIKGQIAYTAEARFFSEQQLSFITPFLKRLKLTREEEDLIAESEKVIAQQKVDLLAAQKAELEKAQAQAIKERKLSRRAMYVALFAIAVSAVAVFFYFQAQAAEAIAEQNAAEAMVAKDAAKAAQLRAEENEGVAKDQKLKAEKLLAEIILQKGITKEALDATAIAVELKDEKEKQRIAAEEKADQEEKDRIAAEEKAKKERLEKEAEIRKNIGVKIDEIKVLIGVGDKDGAREILKEALNVAPNDPELLRLKAKLK